MKEMHWTLKIAAVAVALPVVFFFLFCEMLIYAWDWVRGQK